MMLCRTRGSPNEIRENKNLENKCRSSELMHFYFDNTDEFSLKARY
jgi:hypothetical protein